jgi:DNA-binding response OmpR family regulator
VSTIETKKIVIVEDEPDTAEMFAEMMRLSGYHVLKSYGGTPAIALISHEIPDAVVLDVMMPDLSGLEVLRFLRRDPRLEKIPVIVVSAKSLPSDIKDGLDAGANIYLTKPVAFQDLNAAVRDVIDMAVDEAG